MKKIRQRLPRLPDLERVAKNHTKAALQAAKDRGEWLTKDQEDGLFLHIEFDDQQVIFMLCLRLGDVPAFINHAINDAPEARKVLLVSRAVVNRYTMMLVDEVAVYLPPIEFQDD